MELKPCPFCGGKAKHCINYLGQGFVECEDCEAIFWGNTDGKLKNSIDAWNRRDGEDKMEIKFYGERLEKPDDLTEKASAAWDYFGFDRPGEWKAASICDGAAILVTDESRDLNNAMVYSADDFSEWLENCADDLDLLKEA